MVVKVKVKNKINKKKEIGETKVNFVFPKKEKYIGSHIKSKLGDEYASNESYEEYYKDLNLNIFELEILYLVSPHKIHV